MPARHPARGLFAALAGLSCLAVAGCAAGNAAAVAAHGQPGSHGPSGIPGGTPAVASTVIPAQFGDTWVYAVDSSVLGKGTETARISAVKAVAGGQRVTLSSSLRLAGSKAPFRFASEFTAGAARGPGGGAHRREDRSGRAGRAAAPARSSPAGLPAAAYPVAGGTRRGRARRRPVRGHRYCVHVQAGDGRRLWPCLNR
jgi:hypothetical protein